MDGPFEDFREEIFAHAREQAPRECCGLIDTGGTVHRAHNAATGEAEFAIAAADQFRIFEAMRADGTELAAIYHSHPTTEAYPSPQDIAQARHDCVYLIASLATDELRGFRIKDGEVEEIVPCDC